MHELEETPALRQILDAIAEGIIVQRADGTLLYGNPAVAKACGFASVSELAATPPHELARRFEYFDEHGRPLTVAELPVGRVRSGELEVAEMLLRWRHPGGEDRWSIMRSTGLDGSDGVRLIASVYREVTGERRAVERSARLQAVTAALANAVTREQVARAILADLTSAMHASFSLLGMVDESGRFLELCAEHAYPAELRERFHRASVDDDTPGCVAFRQNRTVLISGAADWRREFPAFAERFQAQRAVACLPLVVDGKPAGVLTVAFPGEHSFGAEDRDLLATAAQLCAQALERTQLFASERAARLRAVELADRLRRVQELSMALSGTLEAGEVARIVVERGADAVGAFTGGLWLADGAHAQLLRDVGFADEAGARYARLSLDDASPLAQAMRSGEPVFLDTQAAYGAQFRGSSERARAIAQTHEVHAIACLPLRVETRVLGGLVLNFDRAHAFDAGEREFLMLIATHAAQALERARIQEENRRALRRLAKLQEMISALSMADHEGEAAQLAVRMAADAVGSASSTLWLLGEDGKLHLRGVIGVPDEYVARFRTIAPDGDLPAAYLFSTRNPIWAADAAEYERVAPQLAAQARAAGRLHAFAALPLEADSGALGVLVFGWEGAHAFSTEEREYIRAVATKCGNSIDRLRLYESEARARQAAEAASKAKDEFLAMLAHELRNPLAPTLTAVQLMKLRGIGPLERERAVIERQTRHLMRLVDDLLDVSRITRGKVQLEREPIELGEVVARAIEMASPLFEQRSHRLELAVPADGLSVDADPARLAQVIGNLLTNAAKYTAEGGRIEVRARADGAMAELAVRDDGAGIAPELLPRVFDLFIQGERSSDRAPGGLGLGLAIVRNLVQLHGGTVTARSDGPGRGAEFVIRIPLAARDRLKLVPPSGAQAAAGGQLRVLVVDDNADAADMLGEVLESMGHQACVVHDGPSALKAAPGFRPDVALLDIGLPVMDGYELAGRLHALPGLAQLPLLALTGSG